MGGMWVGHDQEWCTQVGRDWEGGCTQGAPTRRGVHMGGMRLGAGCTRAAPIRKGVHTGGSYQERGVPLCAPPSQSVLPVCTLLPVTSPLCAPLSIDLEKISIVLCNLYLLINSFLN